MVITAGWSVLSRAAKARLGRLENSVLAASSALAIMPSFWLFGNSGLFMFLMLGLAARAVGWIGLVLAIALILDRNAHAMGAALTAVVVFALVAGLLAWLAERVTVELRARAPWQGWSDSGVVAAWLLAAGVGFGAVLATPPLAVLAFDGLLRVLPEGAGAGWDRIALSFRGGGWPGAILLALAAATPMLSILFLMPLGGGAAIGNAMPATRRFVARLRVSEGPLDAQDIDRLQSERAADYFAGYAVATAICAALAGVMLCGAAAVLIKLL